MIAPSAPPDSAPIAAPVPPPPAAACERDQWFESILLQQRVCERSVPQLQRFIGLRQRKQLRIELVAEAALEQAVLRRLPRGQFVPPFLFRIFLLPPSGPVNQIGGGLRLPLPPRPMLSGLHKQERTLETWTEFAADSLLGANSSLNS